MCFKCNLIRSLIIKLLFRNRTIKLLQHSFYNTLCKNYRKHCNVNTQYQIGSGKQCYLRNSRVYSLLKL